MRVDQRFSTYCAAGLGGQSSLAYIVAAIV
jgi:hypothetical protein